jgi:hypothetical protein
MARAKGDQAVGLDFEDVTGVARELDARVMTDVRIGAETRLLSVVIAATQHAAGC